MELSEQDRQRIAADAKEFMVRNELEAEWNVAQGCYKAGATAERLLAESEKEELRNQIKSLTQDNGLHKISINHERTLKESCEKALAERDTQIEELRSSLAYHAKALQEEIQKGDKLRESLEGYKSEK